MSDLRVGVVGCGPVGALHAAAVRGTTFARLAGLCDVHPGRARELARRLGADIPCHGTVEELLAREPVDVITVATPDHLHVDVVLAAVAAGRHVFCEKPLATTLSDARRMVQAARERGVLLGVDYNRRFGFGYRIARQLCDEGRLGTVRSVLIQVVDRTPPPEVALTPEVILTTLLTHHLDLARWFGGEVSRLAVSAGRQEPSGTQLWREVLLTLEYEDGAIGSIAAGYRDGQSRTWERALIIGSRGTVEVDDVTRSATFWASDPDRREVFEPSPFSDSGTFTATIGRHLTCFLECIRTGEPIPVAGEDALRGLELVEAARRSGQTGGAMMVPHRLRTNLD
ncbi:MAG: Gfo/Idh/MocA family oxidoreductase [Isosphaeraceae bacterium]